MMGENNSLNVISVCWDITSSCNENCHFCFREGSRKELDCSTALQVVDKLNTLGVKKLTFAGGEPLLVQHLSDLLLRAKKYNMTTSITTNGILLNDLWDKIIPNIDWLTFSLDATTAELQSRQGRGRSHFQRILGLVSKVSKTDVNIKINTLVTKHNIHDVLNLAEWVKFMPIKRWKIIRFYPVRGSAKINANDFSIAESEFLNVTHEIKKNFSDTNICIETANHGKLDMEYFSIYSDGVVRFSSDNNDYEIRNLLDFDEGFDDLQKYFNIERHRQKHSYLL